MILMDIHEKDKIKYEVETACDEVEYSNNFCADYIVGDYIIERKRWQEIAGRLLETDRDLYVQLDELKDMSEALSLKPILLIEGDLGATINYSKLPRDRVAEYLAGVTVMDINTVLSTSPQATAKILKFWETNELPDVERMRGAPPSEKEEPRFILEGIGGLGPSKAKNLLADFETVENVVNASPDDLKQVSGIGEKTANLIYNTFRKKYV